MIFLVGYLQKVFVGCSAGFLVTKTSVIVVADDRLSDWVRVLNAGREDRYDYDPVTVHDVKKIASAGLFSSDALFLALEGPVPAAVARIEIGENRQAAICDLSVAPGRRNAGGVLVDYLLAVCRERRVETVTAWLSDHEDRLPDILASYTFEPLKIRSILEARLERRADLADFDSACVRDVTQSPQTAGDQESWPPPWGAKRDLEGLRDDMENMWRIAAVVASNGGKSIAVARLSQLNRARALLSIDEHLAVQSGASLFSGRLIKSVLGGLYRRGVREVLCEAESDARVRDPLLEAGFVQQSMLFQFSLALMHDE